MKAETSLNTGAITEKPIESKGQDWSLISDDCWNKVSDEFLPVALRWKNLREKMVLDSGCGRGRYARDREETFRENKSYYMVLVSHIRKY